MNSIRRQGLATAVLAAALAACSTNPSQKTVEHLDDAATTTEIKSAFVTDEQMSALDVAVNTDKGK